MYKNKFQDYIMRIKKLKKKKNFKINKNLIKLKIK